ncbi:hypothetical protein CHCC14821_0449 [Bacillus paralicheniformis]|nr:hypothetical protein [Bacillus paralicheniformis]TWM30262.1 hypothetical protein CHCC14821_0449 [Bacillus paralicheniformis]
MFLWNKLYGIHQTLFATKYKHIQNQAGYYGVLDRMLDRLNDAF